ncbi:MAG: hypothetical protein PHQ11_03900 [Paludibacter sp.]|nr:hypothetical protein [Paludibacter sp.]
MIDGVKSWNVKMDIEENKLQYNGLYITQNNKGGYNVRGSLHVFFNNGLHNANDYTFTDFADTLNQLYVELGINPRITPLNGFEFGINIKPIVPAKEIINKIILHKSNPGTYKPGYKEFDYKNYTIKIYDKSALTKHEPYHIENILRIEVKVNKMIYIKKHGVYCHLLTDLLNIKTWEQLETILSKTINDLLFIDISEDEINQLNDKEKIMYYKFINPNYWNELHVNRKKYSRERKRCDRFINKHCNSTLKNEILNLLRMKCSELRDVAHTSSIVKKWDKITVFKPDNETTKRDKLTIKINGDSNPPTPCYTDSEQTRCKGCGKVIPNPRKGQFFCSEKDVGYNQAHKCRNNVSNPKNNTIRSLNKLLAIPMMFDIKDVIPPSKIKYLII